MKRTELCIGLSGTIVSAFLGGIYSGFERGLDFELTASEHNFGWSGGTAYGPLGTTYVTLTLLLGVFV